MCILIYGRSKVLLKSFSFKSGNIEIDSLILISVRLNVSERVFIVKAQNANAKVIVNIPPMNEECVPIPSWYSFV